MTKSPYKKLFEDFERGSIDETYFYNAVEKLKAKGSEKERKKESREEKLWAQIFELGKNAHNMYYSELRKYGIFAKAIVDMIVIEIKDNEKSLDLLERFMNDELTGGEVEKIIQGE